MQKKYSYPVDNDQFEEIIRRGQVYVDKTVDDTTENALAQIDDRDYAIQWSADGRRVTKCGISITSEKRNITQWCITDENGTIIENMNFDEKK